MDVDGTFACYQRANSSSEGSAYSRYVEHRILPDKGVQTNSKQQQGPVEHLLVAVSNSKYLFAGKASHELGIC